MENRENVSSCISVLFNAMSICHLRFPGKTIVLFVLCFQNHRPKERKKMWIKFISPYFPERKGRECKERKIREGRGEVEKR